MPTYKKPASGDKLSALLHTASFQGHLVEVVNAFLDGQLQNRTDGDSIGTTIAAVNNLGRAIEENTLVAVGSTWNIASAEDVPGQKRRPQVSIEEPDFPLNLSRCVIAKRYVEDGSVLVMPQDCWQVVKVSGGTGGYAMPNPGDPTTVKLTTSGLWRVLSNNAAQGLAVVDVRDSQPLWRFQLTQDAEKLEVVSADIHDLNAEVFAADQTVTIKDNTGSYCLKSGHTGFCIFADGVFYAVSTASALLGDPTKIDVVKPGPADGPSTIACEDGEVCINTTKPKTSLIAFEARCDTEDDDETFTWSICF